MHLAAIWVFGANDNSYIAWLIFVSYFIVAALCWRSGRAKSAQTTPATRWLWAALCPILVVLGLNKQLDLHQPLLHWIKGSISDWGMIGPGLVAGVAVLATGILTVMWGPKLWRCASVSVRFAYLMIGGLLGLQVLRFLPGQASEILVSHVFTEEDGLWHIHIIEVLELASLFAVGYGALVSSRLADHESGAE